LHEITLYQALILFSWFPLSFMMVVMMLIGRFYTRFSGRRTDWQYLVVPLILYAIATVREARSGFPGDPLSDLIQAVAGVAVLFLVMRLYRWMMFSPPPALTEPPSTTFIALPLLSAAALGVIGPLGIAFLLWALGRFSHQMHHILQGRSYYYGYYVAAALVTAAAILRLPVVFFPEWAVFYAALMVIGCGLGAMMSWRAWSWLLAERE